jgi:hypothetical protein
MILSSCQTIDRSRMTMQLPSSQTFEKDGLSVSVHPICTETIQRLNNQYAHSYHELKAKFPGPIVYLVRPGDI